MSKYTQINSNVDVQILNTFARGVYQQNLLAGWEAWSGATLRGKAAQYSGRYAASRANLIERIRDAGYTVLFTTGGHGRKVAVIDVPAARKLAVAA